MREVNGTKIVSFTVLGKPVAKGRPKFMRRGNYVSTYTPEKTANYETLVKLSFQQAECQKMQGEIAANITAYFPIPKSASKKKRAAMEDGLIGHSSRPDADNITKLILDALNGTAYDDDAQVTVLTVEKLYSDTPRTEIELREIYDAIV